MIVKVFIPDFIFVRKITCALYGEVKIEEKSISYYILSDNCEAKFRLVGQVVGVGQKEHYDVPLIFYYSHDIPHIFLSKLSVKVPHRYACNIIVYNCRDFLLSTNSSILTKDIDVALLQQLVVQKYSQKNYTSSKRSITDKTFYLRKLKNTIHRSAFGNKTFLCRHIQERLSDFCNQVSRPNTFRTILDVFLGVCVTVWISFYGQPDVYLIKLSKAIITHLRTLLSLLKGNPVGLKLNVQLSDFFLDCFDYHINLWTSFLAIIIPTLQNVFSCLLLLGLLGITFHLALVSDLLTLITLHAHCFYIYATLLYNVERIGIAVLWKVFLGRRANILKGRVESHEYVNRQLYISTIFFTSLLFSIPTIFVYYVVFAVLRLFVSFVNYILFSLRRVILEIPEEVFLWIVGRYYSLTYAELELDKVLKTSYSVDNVIFRFHVKKSSPWKNAFLWRTNTGELHKVLGPPHLLNSLFKGEMLNLT